MQQLKKHDVSGRGVCPSPGGRSEDAVSDEARVGARPTRAPGAALELKAANQFSQTEREP